ncbi:MAG: hypothetical protein HOP33_20190 [Verrucomicrobia bacterium]|nr:hypothetical protein [Verrucomicrobiota bacterium]
MNSKPDESLVKKGERNFRDWCGLFRRDLKVWLVLNIVWLGPSVLIFVNSFWGISIVRQELKEAKQERDMLKVQLAPFWAAGDRMFSNAPVDKRLDLLVGMVGTITNELRNTDERTSGIQKSPSGRTRLGGVLMGEPLVIQMEYNIAATNVVASDWNGALNHLERAIALYEDDNKESKIVSARFDETFAMYALGSWVAVHLDKRDKAEHWLEYAARELREIKNPEPPGNIAIYFQLLITMGKTNEVGSGLTMLTHNARNANPAQQERLKTFVESVKAALTEHLRTKQ